MSGSLIKKADYDRIAETYDAARPLSEQTIEVWLRLIAEKVDPSKKVRFLDLGCGTGRFAVPISTYLGFSVTGVDKSEEMIRRAKAKQGAENVRWDVQDAMSMTYPDGSFDAIFISHLLHHVDSPLQVVRECHRVLGPGGVLLNRYGALEDLDDPEHIFFPEAMEIDKARGATKAQVEDWFREAGFGNVSSETIVQRTYLTAEERLRAVSLKSASALTLIDEDAFRRGLEALGRYVAEHPDDGWLVTDKMTLTCGYKG